MPIEQLSSTNTAQQYYFQDSLGSTRALLNQNGAVDATYTYSPSGVLTSSTGTASTPIRFAGGCYDAESGLYYFINRYYDPNMGQFISVDPAVSITGQPYSYANDDPINEDDPLGLGCGIFGFICNTVTRVWNDTGSQAVSAVNQHWRGIAQAGTIIGSGVLSGFCIAATELGCDAALPAIGGFTNGTLYAEGGGQHTAVGYGTAVAEGVIGGSISQLCEVACSLAGSTVVGGALANGSWGAAQGALNYANDGACEHTSGGYISAVANGFWQGAIPWDQILKGISPDS